MADLFRQEMENSELYSPEPARVLRAFKLTDLDAFLELEPAGGRALGHAPGQFVQMSLLGYGEVPISVCSSPSRKKSFEVCVRAVGNVTRAIHRLSAGDWVGIRGPYGRGFPVDRMVGGDVLVIAGGIGIAPLRSLIDFVCDNRKDFRRLIIIYGARNPSTILFEDEVESWLNAPGIETHLIVDQPDDAWKGRSGVVTLPLREIEFHPGSRVTACVVGPPVMYRFVAMELLLKGMSEEEIYFSLERRFKCGIGKCGHCQLNNLYVCQNGPVFCYSELLGHTEAVEVWAAQKGRK